MPKLLNQIPMSKEKKKKLLTDKTFLDKVAARVYELMVADLRHEQERRGGGK